IYVDGELDPIETANWFPKIYRKDYKLGLNLTGVGVDDPDAQFYENYACGSQRNYTGYCNPELQKLFEQQSKETDQEKRKRLVWEIDRQCGGTTTGIRYQKSTCPYPVRLYGHSFRNARRRG